MRFSASVGLLLAGAMMFSGCRVDPKVIQAEVKKQMDEEKSHHPLSNPDLDQPIVVVGGTLHVGSSGDETIFQRDASPSVQLKASDPTRTVSQIDIRYVDSAGNDQTASSGLYGSGSVSAVIDYCKDNTCDCSLLHPVNCDGKKGVQVTFATDNNRQGIHLWANQGNMADSPRFIPNLLEHKRRMLQIQRVTVTGINGGSSITIKGGECSLVVHTCRAALPCTPLTW